MKKMFQMSALQLLSHMWDCSIMSLSTWETYIWLLSFTEFVYPAFDNGATCCHQYRLMMFSLNMVNYSMSFLLLSTRHLLGGQVEGTILSLFEFVCGTPPLCFKVRGGWRWWWPTAFQCQPQSLLVLNLSSTWLRLGLGVFGTKGFGTGLDKRLQRIEAN